MKRKRDVGSSASPSRRSSKLTKRKRKVFGSASRSRHSTKFLKRHKKGSSDKLHSYNHEDRISQLPEDVQLFILSFLTIKEVAMTRFLSTQWRDLGASIPRLDFNASLFPINKGITHLPPYAREDYVREDYVRRVSKVIQSYKGQILEEFRLQYCLTETHKSFIDWCIEFALSKKVRKLDLDFNLPFGAGNDIYEKHLIYMRIYNVIIKDVDQQKKYAFQVGAGSQAATHDISSPVCRSFLRFESLTSLCLRSVRMTGDVLEGLLSTCPILETLTLHHVYDLACLKIAGHSLRLKHLEIVGCGDLDKIELYDVVTIVSFVLYDERVRLHVLLPGWSDKKFLLRNLPGLVDVSFSIISKLVDQFRMLSSLVSQLKHLKVAVYPGPLVDLDYPIIHKLNGLLELEVFWVSPPDQDLLKLVPLLEAAPYLENITIRMIARLSVEEWESRELKEAERRTNGLEHLKVLELAGYRRHPNEDDFISYIITNATALETIIIDPNYQSKPKWHINSYQKKSKLDEIHKVEGYVRQHAKEWLQGIIPPRIELVIR
ncbi:unnamed protein product [Linum tenue]|uniref:F-box domain-containing protein n=1 Tax=Linum tenue TaxID=586396 RepID=A0AAV0GMR5_9ROSI|nr:unnamed protein product [Linum tenue]